MPVGVLERGTGGPSVPRGELQLCADRIDCVPLVERPPSRAERRGTLSGVVGNEGGPVQRARRRGEHRNQTGERAGPVASLWVLPHPVRREADSVVRSHRLHTHPNPKPRTDMYNLHHSLHPTSPVLPPSRNFPTHFLPKLITPAHST